MLNIVTKLSVVYFGFLFVVKGISWRCCRFIVPFVDWVFRKLREVKGC